jgi:hypothetical protein
MGNVFALTLLPIPRLCLHATHDYLSNLKALHGLHVSQHVVVCRMP